VASEEQKEDDGGKGFAGISSMVSNVETTVTRAHQEVKTKSERAPASESAGSTPAAHQEGIRPEPQPYQAPVQPSGGSSTGKWLLGIGAMIGLFWLASESDNKNSPPTLAYSSNVQSPVTVAPAPSWEPPVAQPQSSSRPSEDKPPVGSNNVLTTAQIRYCLAEDIRLDAAKAIINSYRDSDVARFNGKVADYNSRCSEYRYRRKTLESARSETERYRTQLEAEGRSQFVQNPSVSARQALSKSSRRQPDVTTIRAIQRQLNELGYNAGMADGIAGARTRAAIAAYQRKNGMPEDGSASTWLLEHINNRSFGTCEYKTVMSDDDYRACGINPIK
jgi:hypothetical protein